MKYKDRSGNLIERETGQDRFLKKLYTKAIGRFFVRILITRPVTLVCGFFLNRRISAAFIKGFIKNNKLSISSNSHRNVFGLLRREYNELQWG